MMRAVILIFVLFLFFAPDSAAKNLPLSFDLETDHIDITTAFDGKALVVFGAREGRGDIKIIVEGPRKDMVVRKKGRILGAWLNKNSKIFENLPVFYDVAGSGDVDFSFVGSGEKDFKDGFVRNKQARGFYPQRVRPVKFIDDRLFRVNFYIPANVPMGDYIVRAIYTDGEFVQEQRKSFRVAQIGFSADIAAFSRYQSFLYGMVCISLAVFAGWFSNRVRRRR